MLGPIACESCGAFAAEVEHGSWKLCHLCAHAVVRHYAEPETAWRHLDRCECDADVIYPPAVQAELNLIRFQIVAEPEAA